MAANAVMVLTYIASSQSRLSLGSSHTEGVAVDVYSVQTTKHIWKQWKGCESL